MSRKNDIFTGAGMHEQMMQPSIERMEKDLGFDIPVEQVPLPSQGLAYPPGHPLHGQVSVAIRAMTAREEDILTSRALIKQGTVISHLLSSCLMDKSINTRTMLSGDRTAVMIALRITGYGADYNVELDCPACGTHQQCEHNLIDLPIRTLDLEPVEKGSNLFPFKLPVSGKTVHFKFATGEDEEEQALLTERKRKQGFTADSLVTDRLQRVIVSVDGETSGGKINQFVRNMPARDSLTLRRYIDAHEPSVLMEAPFTCISCGHEQEVGLPIGPSFFWPDT
jgi:hypothetical protein|tara:strand:+ start:9646 stop:10488 length:843 start_codon:yes stop_codon:yes gene_type:complete